MSDPRTTPLHERHVALGASFTDFGGWLMPVRYTSDLAEHHAVRTTAGLFDISHMAEFFVEGEDAGEYLDYALAGRLSTMAVGKAKYSLVLDENGGIVDDVIVYRLGDERFLVIANAGNREPVTAALADRLEKRAVGVVDATDDFSLIAVQGPRARAKTRQRVTRSTTVQNSCPRWKQQREVVTAERSSSGSARWRLASRSSS